MTKPLTTADRIRILLDQGLSGGEVAARLGVSRQRVRSADLHRQGYLGRPPLPHCTKCGSDRKHVHS